MKEKKKGNRVIFIVKIIVLAFIFYNVIWIGWRQFKYSTYTENLDVFVKYLSYVHTDKDGYLYNVKLPDYLTYTGNLCVATPDEKYALLIWPGFIGTYEYGVQIEEDDVTYSIMLKDDFSAQDKRFSEMLDKYSEEIKDLRDKAEKMWKIKN